MNTNFATAMRRALESTRAQDHEEATAIIQRALAGSAAADDRAAPPARSEHTLPTARFSLIDPSADDAGIVDKDDAPGHGNAATAARPPLARGLRFSVVDGSAGVGRIRGRPDPDRPHRSL